MKLKFSGKYKFTPKQLMRQCGYFEYTNKQGKTSYIRRIRGEYPRFHAYIDLQTEGFLLNLHLDQKKPTYGSHTAHSGEYNGEVVEIEAAAIKNKIDSFKL